MGIDATGGKKVTVTCPMRAVELDSVVLAVKVRPKVCDNVPKVLLLSSEEECETLLVKTDSVFPEVNVCVNDSVRFIRLKLMVSRVTVLLPKAFVAVNVEFSVSVRVTSLVGLRAVAEKDSVP